MEVEANMEATHHILFKVPLRPLRVILDDRSCGGYGLGQMPVGLGETSFCAFDPDY